MVNVAADVHSMLAGSFGELVTLSDGTVIRGIPSVANAEDTLGGTAIVAGRTKVLRMATADVPNLSASRDTLTWASQLWSVIHVELRGNGAVTRAFLGRAS